MSLFQHSHHSIVDSLHCITSPSSFNDFANDQPSISKSTSINNLKTSRCGQRNSSLVNHQKLEIFHLWMASSQAFYLFKGCNQMNSFKACMMKLKNSKSMLDSSHLCLARICKQLSFSPFEIGFVSIHISIDHLLTYLLIDM
jgi:hypothetical protein